MKALRLFPFANFDDALGVAHIRRTAMSTRAALLMRLPRVPPIEVRRSTGRLG